MKQLLTLLAAAMVASATAQTISGNMEAWTNYSAGFPFPTTALEAPKGWHGSDSLACTFGPLLDPSGNYVKQVFKTTDKHSGSFAAKLVTKNFGSIGIYPAVISNATSMELDTAQTIPIKLKGGMPVSQRLDYANAWVKLLPATPGEEAQMYVEAVIAGAGPNGDDLVVGTGQTNITETNVYELVSTNITYNDPNVVPTHIRVVFISSYGNATDGTELYVDDVTVSLFPVGVERVFNNEPIVKVYPTITSGTVYFNSSSSARMNIRIFSNTGQVVTDKTFTGPDKTDLGHLPEGFYFYTISTGKTVVQKGKLSIVK